MFSSDLKYLERQHTIAASVAFVGIGLHSGRRVTLHIGPAPADHGITIVRRDIPGPEGMFEATWRQVVNTELCTTLGNAYGREFSTIEHLLSALHGLGIDNAKIEIDGPEIPILDGSALPIVTALKNAGVFALPALRRVIVIRRPVHLRMGESWAELLPDKVPRITISIDFNHHDIGTQSLSCCLSPTVYEREIAPARTFGFAERLAQLRRRGFARGGSIKNAVLLRGGRVTNREGLRFRDEFVRHKALDAIGDLALAGSPIIGHYRSNRPSHRLNVEMLRLLMSAPKSWQYLSADAIDSLVDANEKSAETSTGRTTGSVAGDRKAPASRDTLFARGLRLIKNERP